MPDLLLELFSEEIPARFQIEAEKNLKDLFIEAVDKKNVSFETVGTFSTPRRLVLVVTGLPKKTMLEIEEKRGPNIKSEDKAVEGFAKSLNISRDQLFIKTEKKGEFFYAKVEKESEFIAGVIATILYKIVSDFPWANSMRWGSGNLKWIRPLHSILCLLHDETECNIVPLSIDGIVSSNVCRGHRFAANNEFRVSSFDEYEYKMKEAKVILDRNSRKAKIWNDARTLAFINEMEVIPDEKLLEEVVGLVEWPVVLWGEIDSDFHNLPPEVLQVSMREHQKFFSVTKKNSKHIISYISVANIETSDHGHAISVGNNKVLNARLSDAKFFLENDLSSIDIHGYSAFKQRLKAVTFHNEIGSEYDRVKRISDIAVRLAKLIEADIGDVKTAASLCKLDLVSEMVCEFPELQGVMGKYYALQAKIPIHIAEACSEHYCPKGPFDKVPENPVSLSIALADKIDLLTNFWAINRKPTGSKDPFALRRAAIGIIRILLDRELDITLITLIKLGNKNADVEDLIKFFQERLRIYLLDKGIKTDIFNACSLAMVNDTSLVDLYKRVLAVSAFVETKLGKDLVQTYKRAINILKVEERKDGVEYSLEPSNKLMKEEELKLHKQLIVAEKEIQIQLKVKNFENGLKTLANLKSSLDIFFDKIKINSDNQVIRRNRLCLLNQMRQVMHRLAKFSEIEGD